MDWHDDPINCAIEDRLDRARFATKVTDLISKTHSWNSSVVFGLTGPWGSGKSSLIEMICERLCEQYADWLIIRFTPWATSSVEGLLSEFYAALSGVLPEGSSNGAKEALIACAKVASPLLGNIPVFGDSFEKATDMGLDALTKKGPWAKVFGDAAAKLKSIGRPLLVVADDIDRLEKDELMSLLKVVRLLGRFPGVNYLLAYDEETIFATLDKAQSPDGAGRRYMEKIVQYPIEVPPLLSYQILGMLESKLNYIFNSVGRPLYNPANRIARLARTFERQLLTPRAIDRFLAQVQLYASMHDKGEINDVDLILLTFVKLQFPEVYRRLPDRRDDLTAQKQAVRFAGAEESVDWSDLFRGLNNKDERDARAVLASVFPNIEKFSYAHPGPNAARESSYFPRYFVHGIPEDDLSDSEIGSALAQANSSRVPSELFHKLLSDTTHGRAKLAVSKLWDMSIPRDSLQIQVSVNLLAAVSRELTNISEDYDSIFSGRGRAERWASEIMLHLPENTSPTEISDALNECLDLDTKIRILLSACVDNQGTTPKHLRNTIKDVGRTFSDLALSRTLNQLRLGDFAITSDPALFRLVFIKVVGDPIAARDEIAKGLGAGEYTVEDLAARCVVISQLLSSEPTSKLDSVDTATFSTFAPEEHSFYSESLVEDIDQCDTSWCNRRAFARGRVRLSIQ